MILNFSIDTDTPLDNRQRAVLLALAGTPNGAISVTAVSGSGGAAAQTPDAPAKAAPVKRAPAKAVAPKPEEEEPAAEEEAKPEGLSLAVAKATELVSSGNAQLVKSALASVGAKRVSELTSKNVGAFLLALTEDE